MDARDLDERVVAEEAGRRAWERLKRGYDCITWESLSEAIAHELAEELLPPIECTLKRDGRRTNTSIPAQGFEDLRGRALDELYRHQGKASDDAEEAARVAVSLANARGEDPRDVLDDAEEAAHSVWEALIKSVRRSILDRGNEHWRSLVKRYQSPVRRHLLPRGRPQRRARSRRTRRARRPSRPESEPPLVVVATRRRRR